MLFSILFNAFSITAIIIISSSLVAIILLHRLGTLAQIKFFHKPYTTSEKMQNVNYDIFVYPILFMLLMISEMLPLNLPICSDLGIFLVGYYIGKFVARLETKEEEYTNKILKNE
jgi:hypothetical protein